MLNFDKNTQLIVDADTPLAIRAAHDAVVAAKEANEASVIAVAHAVERQDACSKYLAANFKPTSFLDEFRRSTSQPGKGF